jgi:hypothetical protein
LLEPWDVRELYIRKTADLPLQLLVDTFPRFVAIGFYFLSETHGSSEKKKKNVERQRNLRQVLQVLVVYRRTHAADADGFKF